MSEEILPLDHSTDPTLVGGKAASLAHMVRAGLKVPGGFVVSVKAFREAKRSAVSDSALGWSVPDGFEDAFRSAWHDHIGVGNAAVRSSATVEDSSAHSFAGQFESFLNVKDPDSGLGAMRKCWASAFAAHVEKYRGAISPSEIGMAVVVQKMVAAECAGVAFTSEPVTTSDNVAYAEWVAGFGDQLVSGERVDGRLWFDIRGDTLRVDWLVDTEAPVDAIAHALALEIPRARQALGSPRLDIEWAWCDGELYILQARPITAMRTTHPAADIVGPWLLPGRPRGGWSDEERRLFDTWDEYNPPAVSPLSYQLHMARVWQATIEMLVEGDVMPDVRRCVRVLDNVPIAIQPDATRALQCWIPRAANPHENLTEVMEAWATEARLLTERAARLSEMPPDVLCSILVSAGDTYARAASSRLRAMSGWIGDEERSRQRLSELCVKVGCDADAVVASLAAGVDHDTNRMNEQLNELRRNAPGLTSSELDEQVKHFVREFGHFEFHGSLLSEIPAVATSILSGPDSLFASDRVSESKERFEETLAALVGVLSQSDKRDLEECVAALRAATAARENSKTRQNLARPVMNAALREIAARLLDSGAIGQLADVELCSVLELRRALEGTPVSSRTLDYRRTVMAWKATRSWLPVDFLGKRYSESDQILRGIGGSPGTARGRARVIRTLPEFINVQPGDIVVAHSTNPLWTQLFSRIAGIVVENGSRISHAAITAREYGIPSVVGIPGLLDAIASGETIEIDGSQGTIVRTR